MLNKDLMIPIFKDHSATGFLRLKYKQHSQHSKYFSVISVVLRSIKNDLVQFKSSSTFTTEIKGSLIHGKS